MAENKKRLRAIAEPCLHDARRVSGYSDEYAANYLIIYDDELEDDDFSADSKDVQAECDEIAAPGCLVNPRDAFRGSLSAPPDMKWIDPIDAAAFHRGWASKQPELKATRQ